MYRPWAGSRTATYHGRLVMSCRPTHAWISPTTADAASRTARRLSRMKVMMASDCGHPGRQNEDFVGAVPNAVVLLDGAGIPGTDVICHHSVAWYSHTLGTTLLRRLSREPGTDLVAALADSIE